ncbi:OpgC family protein [Bartonella ancashensis]|uniref:OpgC protein n=1 Tax=Bartonella ancashensis TaxID=1318743 RepID=A0A0M4LS08_9HYPH|nr:OpgC domain-containing protein [Bartonella ancashensis]ALE03122.1 OpgC protein [Bartonella ancashensis]
MTYNNVVSHSSASSHRNTHVDVFRSLALLTIFINHIPGTIYSHMTHKNFGFSDSTEVFVLLSGIALGLTCKEDFPQEIKITTHIRKSFKRALKFYTAYLSTSFITLFFFIGAFFIWQCDQLIAKNNISLFITDPFIAFLSLLSFGHQLGYNNILSLYIVFALFSPFALYLSSKNKGLFLLGSFVLYLVCSFYRTAPPSYPLPGHWFLNPLSWQFLFVIGLTSTLYIKQGGRIICRPLIIFAAISYLILSLLWVRLHWWGSLAWIGWSWPLFDFNKTFLGIPRLLHIISLSSLILCLPCLYERFNLSNRHCLTILGKHGLPVFTTGTVVAMAAQVINILTTRTFLSDSFLVFGGIGLQFAVAYCCEYYANRKFRLSS